jgi:hypothetical protein
MKALTITLAITSVLLAGLCVWLCMRCASQRFTHIGTANSAVYIIFDHKTAQACWAGPQYSIGSPDGKQVQQAPNPEYLPFCKDLKLTPHFGGAAWVRRGSQTIVATEALYQQMVDARQSKTHELLRWLNKEVTVEGTPPKPITFDAREYLTREWAVGQKVATLAVVNGHWVTFKVRFGADFMERSEPMERLLLSWDDEKNRLKVLVRTWSKS